MAVGIYVNRRSATWRKRPLWDVVTNIDNGDRILVAQVIPWFEL